MGRLPEVDAQQASVDALNHQYLASALISHVEALPLGSVISIQGSWGRGKTDVLARAYSELCLRAKENGHPEPLWLNPWQYGIPDLIKPVVLNLLERLPPGKRSSTTLRRAAKTLLRAGNAMLFKALTVVAPFGEVIGAAEGSVDDFLNELFEPGGNQAAIDADPVAVMAERFRDLVDEYLALMDQENGRLIVCVDDLDRCLPDHQIAMLEAIYFLTGAKANCSFLVALDPTLVQQAAVTHYKTAGFDSNQYLDKLFDLRISLRALRDKSIEGLIDAELDRKVVFGGRPVSVGSLFVEAFAVENTQIRETFGGVIDLPEITNPRLIRRIFERLQLLARAVLNSQDARLHDDQMFLSTVIWCIISERWPQLRQILQASARSGWLGNLEFIAKFYGWEGGDSNERERQAFERSLERLRNFTIRLPDKDRHPDVGEFIYEQIVDRGQDLIDKLMVVDDTMLDLGL